ncbi:hypothetical protein [Salibaculum halophilum]|uniref:hypothetical protein n=1 Tax=Salibaculum halophilum TaxID=1914408 RepID=UPI000A1092C8|nr:hypothetical protein [Salibaculum halophilum]
MTNDTDSNHAQPIPDWRAFADLVLDILMEPAYRNFTCLAASRSRNGEQDGGVNEQRDPGARKTRTTSAAPADPLDVDSLLDAVEQDGMDDGLPPCPEAPPARETRYSLRVPVMMHVLRLARTFRTPDEFR